MRDREAGLDIHRECRARGKGPGDQQKGIELDLQRIAGFRELRGRHGWRGFGGGKLAVGRNRDKETNEEKKK